MNKKVITIGLLAMTALILLTLYTFGPLAGRGGGATVNPVSRQAKTEYKAMGPGTPVTNTYHNRDIKENFYTLSVPDSWQLESSPAGAYHFTFSGGEGTVELMDIPDNTTPELLVLSQEEPRFKNVLPGYQRLNYQKLSINGNEAYQLIYQYTDGKKTNTATRTTIVGKDRAGVLSLISEKETAPGLQAIFTSVLNGFKWENQ